MQIDDTVDTRITEDRIRKYSVAVLTLGYIVQVGVYFKGGVDSALIPLLMFIPGIVAVVFRRREGTGNRAVGWKPRNIRYLMLAIFLPLVLAMGLTFALQSLGWATLTVFTLSEGLITAKVPLVLGNHPQELSFFVVNLGLSFVPITVLGGLFTIGEEYGWRGYLQSKMVDVYGKTKGLVLLGLLVNFDDGN